MTAQFFSLTPERVLEAVEAGGARCTGLCMQLNSMENRVYELELEDRARVVAKFYRPGRWSREAIVDEHEFLADLASVEVPVASPLPFPDGSTVRQEPLTGILYALFPRVGGRAPEELSEEQLRRLGGLLGRVHNVGAAREAPHRRALDPETYGAQNLAVLREAPTLPPRLRALLVSASEALLAALRPRWEGLALHRIHGDCHRGNLLWGAAGPFFLDFDDMVRGPAVQDVWLLVPGQDADAARQRDVLLEGYEVFRPFPRATLALVEPLRALRYLRHAAWITRRWDDPSFPRTWPEYGSERWWATLVDDLEEQLSRVTDGAPRARVVTMDSPRAGLRVTLATEADALARASMVREEVLLEELGVDPERDQDGRDRDALHLLAVDASGRACGYARLHRDGPRLVLTRVAVLPGSRRRGVGRALVGEASARGRAQGATMLHAEPQGAEGFLRSLGFEGPSGGLWALDLREQGPESGNA
ncbi:MAG: serine/threonine protein kinase [Deltaproteobacteria bacterium]|nr:serine/threonine protein kinase [Deltaproteobacteria bacterium]